MVGRMDGVLSIFQINYLLKMYGTGTDREEMGGCWNQYVRPQV